MLEFLKFSVGGYHGYTNVKIMMENRLVKVKIDSMLHPLSNGETILPFKQGEKWIDKLEALCIRKWKSKYDLEDMRICDGEQWSLEYKEVGERCRHIAGDNAYPPNWTEFLSVMNEVSPMDIPMQIDEFDFEYKNYKELESIDEIDTQKVILDYFEKISIDRKSEKISFIKHIGSGCEIRHECFVEMGVVNLLDDLMEFFTEDNSSVVYELPVNPTFSLNIKYQSGDIQQLSGSYNRHHLPDYWKDMMDCIAEFISFYGFLGDTFNSTIFGKGVKENELIYCTVNYNNNTKGFYYQTTDDTLAVGDVVIVPVGKDNTRREATIKKIEYFTEDTVPFPIGTTKHILCRKLDNHSNDEIFKSINYEVTKNYFLSLLKAKELPIYKFCDELYKMNCMLSNYYDYLEYEPMDVDKEMQRIDTVDFVTAFAILTMVFREDYFCNGAIIRRVEDGTLDEIINKIKTLFNEA